MLERSLCLLHGKFVCPFRGPALHHLWIVFTLCSLCTLPTPTVNWQSKSVKSSLYSCPHSQATCALASLWAEQASQMISNPPQTATQHMHLSSNRPPPNHCTQLLSSLTSICLACCHIWSFVPQAVPSWLAHLAAFMTSCSATMAQF